MFTELKVSGRDSERAYFNTRKLCAYKEVKLENDQEKCPIDCVSIVLLLIIRYSTHVPFLGRQCQGLINWESEEVSSSPRLASDDELFNLGQRSQFPQTSVSSPRKIKS